MENTTQELRIKRKGLILVLISVFFWGISFISTKVLLTEYPPVSIAFFRQFIALIPLIILIYRRKEVFKPSLKTVLHMSLGSFFGVVLYFVFENTGLSYISASGASILVAAIPILTLPVESRLNKKKMDFLTLFFIFLSWVGVYLVISSEDGKGAGSDPLKGALLIFGAMVSWIVYTIITDRMGEKYSSLQMTTMQTLLSIPLFIPFTIHEMPLWHLPSGIAILHLTFLGIFCSAVAYVFFLYGITVLGPTVSSTYLNLIPLVTMVTGALFLNERLSILQLAGALLILLSLGLISFLKLKSGTKNVADVKKESHEQSMVG